MKRFSTLIGGKRIGLITAALCLWASVGVARADMPLWYNGDFDGNGAIYNGVVPLVQAGHVYDDFFVPANTTWSISDVFSNDLLSTDDVSFASWRIRSGVSPGNGGTLLYSGVSAATASYVGPGLLGYAEYDVNVSGLTGILLSGGPTGTTYWLSVSPLVASGDVADIVSTSGANAIPLGNGQDGNSYVAGSYYTSLGGYNFEPASDYYANPCTGLADFSMGVNGVVVTSIPEPSTLVLSIIGALGLLSYAWRGRRLQY